MKSLIIINVGTSLLHSVTWEHDDLVDKLKKATIPAKSGNLYDDVYTKMLKAIDSPEKRKRYSEDFEDFVQKSLKSQDLPWKNWVKPYEGKQPNERKRYSAEITTLLALADLHSTAYNEGWRGFLKSNDLVFVCEEDDADKSKIIANHLVDIIETMIETKHTSIKVKKVYGYSSMDRETIKKALVSYTYDVMDYNIDKDYAEVFVIVSGGYKIYSMLPALYLENNANMRIVYMNENANDPIIHDKFGITLGDDRIYTISVE